MLDRCILMIQSPFNLFCYWKISNIKRIALQHHLNGEWQSFQKKLRLYDITDLQFNGHNANRYLDFLISNGCSDYFIKGVNSSGTYCVDVGVETRDGLFLPFLRSNSVHTVFTQDDTELIKSLSSKWKLGNENPPIWLEGYSSYSYYESRKLKGTEK